MLRPLFSLQGPMRVFDGLLNLLAACAAAMLLMVMLSIGADVSLRALGGGSLIWALELSEHSLLIMVFLGMPWLAREGGHISVELVTDRLPEARRRALTRLTSVLVALLLAWLALWAARLSLADWRAGILTIGIYPIPRYWLSAIVGCGLLLTALEFLRQGVSGRVAQTAKGGVA